MSIPSLQICTNWRIIFVLVEYQNVMNRLEFNMIIIGQIKIHFPSLAFMKSFCNGHSCKR